MAIHPAVQAVTQRIIARSADTRGRYLQRSRAAYGGKVERGHLACANFAHALAAMADDEKARLKQRSRPNLAIVSAYNDMLSAHQPLGAYPAWIKQAAFAAGGTAQFAGGVPAMCDGITQGRPGMELSLFSRDVIAMSTAIALSHPMFDAGVFLGVCDKIVPGMLIGALSFGHLPAVFVPAGPMPTGISNTEKSLLRQRHAQSRAGDEELLDSEMRSYHGPGTCTFYGTANSNQMLMEIMGLHLPGSAFVPPNTALREALTRAAARRALQITAQGEEFTPVAEVIDEKAIVNGIVGLLATGGSTNHTLHLVAVARAAGIVINWDDFSDLSAAVPLLARIYPNGGADVNHFQAAGGMPVVIAELLGAGLLHGDVRSVAGPGLERYTRVPCLEGGALAWREGPAHSLDPDVIRPVARPFSPDGGLKRLQGNLGRAVVKVSAVAPEHRVIQAPARVFDSQDALLQAYNEGSLASDFVAVVRYQGPKANGMPELHKLTPVLSVLQDRGLKVALLTDGRMSGASGKVPAAIHAAPEALAGGPLAYVRDGDTIRIDTLAGRLDVLAPDGWLDRPLAGAGAEAAQAGLGRELFYGARRHATGAESGASIFGHPDWL
ncbi:phosphogluconate dehydratase [Parapusillimonas granuli]|uniref:Phosphogluconate dehydratase n=1 Tax=Parapusillimonas granuli TaxID=380911 RepID=A0A853G1V8_9BURK|nr:phosphogluconate dehydratase [Parapusillimonas granuli]MBB5213618.1 phosphogluconate dehydratase [Parapusillimonas granuli]NYT48456.1 phosphogluconate dehydratase [Parapusillimonas granuli]